MVEKVLQSPQPYNKHSLDGNSLPSGGSRQSSPFLGVLTLNGLFKVDFQMPYCRFMNRGGAWSVLHHFCRQKRGEGALRLKVQVQSHYY